MFKVLHNSERIKASLESLFSTETRKLRRIIISGFVGQNTGKLLDIKGDNVKLYCWPKIGSTDIPEIEHLIRQKIATVYFVQNLHSKIYWVEKKGFVICSANFTKNGLGKNPIIEAGVFCDDSSEIEIDKLIKSYGVKNSVRIDTKAFADLIRQHNRFRSKSHSKNGDGTSALRSYKDWRETYYGKEKPDWKIGFWEKQAKNTPNSVKKVIRRNYSIFADKEDPADWIVFQSDNFKNEFKKYDWLLIFKLSEEDRKISKISNVTWMYVDGTVKLTPEDEKYYGGNYCVFQEKLNKNLFPPFDHHLHPFEKSLEDTVKDIDYEKMSSWGGKNAWTPSKDFLSKLDNHHK